MKASRESACGLHSAATDGPIEFDSSFVPFPFFLKQKNDLDSEKVWGHFALASRSGVTNFRVSNIFKLSYQSAVPHFSF